MHTKHAKDFNDFTWLTGKKILAKIRGGDYAHAGEEEALDKIFAKFKPDAQREILDIGCGLGGTAHYIQEHGWGKVTGFDIEEPAIAYAKEKYAKTDFFTCDAADLTAIQKNLGKKKFDLICLIHALCVFKEPIQALQNLSAFAKPNATLVIFEYLDLSNGKNLVDNCNVFSKEQLTILLQDAGWKITDYVDVSKEFEIWYQKLIDKAIKIKAEIIAQFGPKYFDSFCHTYTQFLNAIKTKNMGGCIVYAKPRSQTID